MKYRVLLIGFCLMMACKNNQGKVALKDTASIVIDSLSNEMEEEEEEQEECYADFFKATATIDTNKLTVIDAEGTSFKLPDFIKEQDMLDDYLVMAIKDVDNDSIPELWMKNYSGGAHCCDEWYVFLKQKDGRYRQRALLTAGNVCVDDSIFTFSFDEPLGYFKSCFACSYQDSAKGFVMMRQINLRYKKGKFEVINYGAAEEQQLTRNLQILKEASGDKENIRDIKKEFAMNMAVYHYNHNKNFQLTKKLFNQYYPFSDRAEVWQEFTDYLKEITAFNGI